MSNENDRSLKFDFTVTMKIYHHPLLILTCKHLRERKRRFCHTIWEILSGVLVFVILLLMRQVIKHSTLIDETRTETESDNDYINEIIFIPNDQITQKFMSKINNIHEGSYRTPLPKLRGFNNEAEILDYLNPSNVTYPVAVVRFNKMNNTKYILEYTIDILNKEKVEPHNSRFRLLWDPHDSEQHISLPLMKLQWNIDRTFMEFLSGTDIEHSIEVPLNSEIFPSKTERKKKTPLSIIHQFLVFCTMAAPLPFFLYNSSRLINERRSGLKEMMKIVGVSPNILRFSHLIDTAILSTVYAGLITAMLKITSTPILPESNPIIIAMTIILHFLNITSLAFVTSALSQAYVHAHSLSLIIYVASCALCNICHNRFHNAFNVYFISWFLPHAPVHLFWDEVKYLERIGEGLHFSNIVDHHSHGAIVCVPVFVSWAMFLVQQLFIMTLAWYLDLVRPGQRGVPQQWNFIFKRQYWVHKKKVTFHVTVEQKERVLRDDRYFQKPLRGPIAIKISQLTKIYEGGFRAPKQPALDNINIDIYEGEVTVILGMHGSGKSTLIDIVTGMSGATSGHVYVKGYDTSARMRDVSGNLGLCPQEHLTFDYLTVRENITFFQLIRGQQKDTSMTADMLIDRLRLHEQADYFSCQLSASQERCLQVACALVGGADILLLDEPTANCDAATRHYLWDVIMVLRGDKTVVMTTSSIEEADAIADRVALLSHGKLKCYGTPLFLKDALGTGVNLSITLLNNSHINSICKIVDEALPDAFKTEPVDSNDSSLSFMLPGKHRAAFPKLFDTLEKRRSELGIETMRVGVSMEEMFYRFIDDDDDEEEGILIQRFDDVKEVTGWRLCIQRMRVLIMRNFYQIWSVKYQFLILNMMVPVLGLIVISVTTNSHGSLRGAGAASRARARPAVLLDPGPARAGLLGQASALNPSLRVVPSREVPRDFKNLTSVGHGEPAENLVGIEIHNHHSNLYLDVRSQAEATRAVNAFSNVYMSLVLPYNHVPINTSSTTAETKFFMPKETILCLLWSMWVAFIVTMPLTPFIAATIHEYTSGVRYTHFVVGCPHLLHWLAKMAAHTIIFLTIIPPSVLLCAKFLDYEDTLTEDDFLGAVFVALLMFLPAFLLQLYVLSFFLSEQHAVSLIYIQSIALGFSAPIIQILLLELSEVADVYAYPMHFLTLLGRASPVFTLSELMARFTAMATVKSYCLHNDKYCSSLLPTDDNTEILHLFCCGPPKPNHRYFSDATVSEIITLVFHVFLYSVMLLAVQKRWIQNFVENIANVGYKETTLPVYNDFNVYYTKLFTKRMMNCIKTQHCLREEPSEKMLLVDNLHKKYVNPCNKARQANAVRGVSFCVKAGESLVLLGKTGAGKTSTLLMIAGSTCVTRGDCFVAGELLRKNRTKYIKKVSFTKRTGGLDDFYSGYDNLKILCLLHGFKQRRAEIFALNCMAYLGLSQHLFEPVRAYSEGSARRLGLSAALLAAPPAVLLDEPMRALHPHARRCVARALASLERSGSAVLVAEHSLDWRVIDSLFTSVAFMSKGRLEAIGPCSYVRELLANGHTVRIKLKLKSIRTYVYEESSDSFTSSDSSTEKVGKSEISAPKVSHESDSSSTKSSSEDDDPTLRSRLEKAQVDIIRGNITRSSTSVAQRKPRRPRPDKTQDIEFQSMDSKMSVGSERKESRVPSVIKESKSYELLATGLNKTVLRQLKADFLRLFPTSELTDEHLPMLYFQIRADLDNVMPYSLMFSKLQSLKNKYQDIMEDYSLSEISVEDVYCMLAKESELHL